MKIDDTVQLMIWTTGGIYKANSTATSTRPWGTPKDKRNWSHDFNWLTTSTSVEKKNTMHKHMVMQWLVLLPSQRRSSSVSSHDLPVSAWVLWGFSSLFTCMWGKLGTLIVYVVIQTQMAANYPNSYSSQRYIQPQKTYKICLRSACLFTSMCVHLCVFKALCNLQSRCLQLHKNYHLEPLEHIKLVMHCIALCVSQTKKEAEWIQSATSFVQ